MDQTTLIGTIAAFCTTISFLPQVIRIRRTRHAKDLSLVMYIILAFGVLCWLIYGILLNSAPIIAANAITLILCSYIIRMRIKYK